MVVRCLLKIPSGRNCLMPNNNPSDRIFTLHYGFFFFAYSFFDKCTETWIRVVLSIYTKLTTILPSRKVRYGSSLFLWRRNVWRKLTWKWRQNLKLRQNVKVRKKTFPSPGRVHGNSGRVCKKLNTRPGFPWFPTDYDIVTSFLTSWRNFHPSFCQTFQRQHIREEPNWTFLDRKM